MYFFLFVVHTLITQFENLLQLKVFRNIVFNADTVVQMHTVNLDCRWVHIFYNKKRQVCFTICFVKLTVSKRSCRWYILVFRYNTKDYCIQQAKPQLSCKSTEKLPILWDKFPYWSGHVMEISRDVYHWTHFMHHLISDLAEKPPSRHPLARYVLAYTPPPNYLCECPIFDVISCGLLK